MAIETLYILESVADLSPVAEIVHYLGVAPRRISDVREAYADLLKDPDPIRRGKTALILTRNQGAFIRPCPGTRRYTCCGYRILHVGTYCTMDCSYCILQTYFHPPVLQFFVNHGDLFQELSQAFASPSIRRLGTGEFTDSLIWDSWTGLSQRLVPRFARQNACLLELKTKTAHVSALEGLEHNRKTLVAWSLNTPRVIECEERGTAGLSERLRDAAHCQALGYPLAFHFDPLVIDDGCEAEYGRVVDALFAAVHPENIVWISLGAFRFAPELKALIQRRHPESRIPYGEFIRGQDGKMRYFKPLRIRLYREMARKIREADPEIPLYLCMEDDEVWEKGLGRKPPGAAGLKRMLDAAAKNKCGLRSE